MSPITTKTKYPNPEPDWSLAPESARWWAVDSDGYAYWFVNEPCLDEETGVWDVDGFPRPTRDIWFECKARLELDPADTLHQRPEKKEEAADQPQLGPLDRHAQAYRQVEQQHAGWILPETLRQWMVDELAIDQDLPTYELQLRRPKRRILLTELQRLQPYFEEADADADD